MKELTFEEKLNKLKKITEKLESGSLLLDEALTSFEEGIGLSKDCYKTLNEAEKKIEVLIKQNGEVVGKKAMDEDEVPY